MRNTVVRWAAGVVLAAASVMLAPTSARACASNPPTPPTIHIEQMGPNTFCIWVCNYTAAGALQGDFCVCALNKLGVIQNVKSVQMFNQAMTGSTNDPCNPGGFLQPVEFWNFQLNPNTGPSFSVFAGEGDWDGFLSQTFQQIPPGQRPITIKFTVNLVPTRATLSDLVMAIESGEPFIGTGKGNPDGTIMFNPMHPPAAMPAGPVTVLGNDIPTVSQWGLIAMGLLLLSGGVIAMRHLAARPRTAPGA